ncbi:MAG: hypothetical protein WC683_00990 [bacterium]
MSSAEHAELVEIAAVWLRNTRKCRVVATEIVTATSETPDAIGWTSRESIVVECKVSREDFFRNEKKAHERAGSSVGDEKWFLTPEGLVRPGEVPEGWGLLEVHRTGYGARGYWVKKTVHAPSRERTVWSVLAERKILVSVAQRSLTALDQVRPLSLGDVETEEHDERDA